MVGTEGFSFTSVSWLDDPMFLPGILRYGGIETIWLLNKPFETVKVDGSENVVEALDNE